MVLGLVINCFFRSNARNFDSSRLGAGEVRGESEGAPELRRGEARSAELRQAEEALAGSRGERQLHGYPSPAERRTHTPQRGA